MQFPSTLETVTVYPIFASYHVSLLSGSPGSSAPVHTPLLGTRTRSSRTWGSSRWGSGWHGCTPPGERCTQCGNTRSPRRCTHTGCNDRSPENTIPPRSICCRCPRRWFPAVRPLRSPIRPVRKAVVPRRPCVLCAPRKDAHWKPWWFICFTLLTKKLTSTLVGWNIHCSPDGIWYTDYPSLRKVLLHCYCTRKKKPLALFWLLSGLLGLHTLLHGARKGVEVGGIKRESYIHCLSKSSNASLGCSLSLPQFTILKYISADFYWSAGGLVCNYFNLWNTK